LACGIDNHKVLFIVHCVMCAGESISLFKLNHLCSHLVYIDVFENNTARPVHVETIPRDDEIMCVICQDIPGTSKWTNLPCGHGFHIHCIDCWL